MDLDPTVYLDSVEFDPSQMMSKLQNLTDPSQFEEMMESTGLASIMQSGAVAGTTTEPWPPSLG